MRFLFAAITLILGGCTVVEPLQPVSVEGLETKGIHKITSTKDTQYRSCDFETWFVKGSRETFGANERLRRKGSSSMFALPPAHLQAAKAAFPYALMASNVYRGSIERPVYTLPSWQLIRRFRSDSGLEFEELHRVASGKVVELAVVYKGTDGSSWSDWKTNFSIWWEPRQYAEAHKRFLEILSAPEYKSIPISVAGHSLGGGIALNVSLRHSTVQRPIRAFVFNASPRAFYQPIYPEVKADRLLLDEKAEFLWGGRLFWQSKIRALSPFTYNFINFKLSPLKPVNEHSIYLFSRALLLVAVNQGDTYARQVIRANIPINEAEHSLPSMPEYLRDLDHDLKYCRKLLADEA